MANLTSQKFSANEIQNPRVLCRWINGAVDLQAKSSDDITSTKVDTIKLFENHHRGSEPIAIGPFRASSEYRASENAFDEIAGWRGVNRPMALYFRDISKSRLLSQEKEIELAKRIDECASMITRTLARFPPATHLLLAACRQAQEDGSRPSSIIVGLVDQPVRQINGPDLIDAHLVKLAELYSSVMALSARLDPDHGLCRRQRYRLSLEFARLKLTPDFLRKLLTQVQTIFKSAEDPDREKSARQEFYLANQTATAMPHAGSANSVSNGFSRQFEYLGEHGKSSAENSIESASDREAGPALGISLNELAKIKTDLALGRNMLARAKQEFSEANLRLVVHIAKQYPRGDVIDLGDLIQEGNIGLLKAVDRFDYRKGCKFSTYATYWIRLSISRAIASKSRIVRVPFRKMANVNVISAVRSRLEQENEREPNLKELSQKLNISTENIEEALVFRQNALSLDSPLTDDGNTCSRGALVEQSMFPPLFDTLAAQEFRAAVSGALKSLNPKEAKIVRSRFGIGVHNELTLQELGDELGVTRERVRQIQTLALKRLNKRFGEKLRDFLD